ncbi:MAG: hypothetical protein OES64_06880 [Desulfobacteraceae bacterium]|nr:hypothetical protein [Desulfobacteraceae bacterium]MDH3881259.1 hypothetical protein [Desulfobacteraceae bacterium]PLX52303.1 MAG: hypothetical protein C0611_08305 [Desulfobacteraceae bacterium]
MWIKRCFNFFCLFTFTIGLFYIIGCSKPYGLKDVSVSGSGKIVVFENVQFSDLLQATHEALDRAEFEVIEEIEQPKFNVFVIIARSAKVDTLKVRIKRLSETSHELALFVSTESGSSEEQSFNRDLLQEIEKRLTNDLKK